MPLCTTADVKLAAWLDADITAHDAEIPRLIAAATTDIEQECNVPSGWFDQWPAPRGWESARGCCIALASLRINDRGFDGTAMIRSMTQSARYWGAMPELGTTANPSALYMLPDYVTADYVVSA